MGNSLPTPLFCNRRPSNEFPIAYGDAGHPDVENPQALPAQALANICPATFQRAPSPRPSGVVFQESGDIRELFSARFGKKLNCNLAATSPPKKLLF